MKQEWAIMRLGDAATFINGYPFKPSDWSNIGLPIIRIQNLTESSQNINYYAGQIDKRYLIQDGDVLISWSASLGVYEWKNGNAWLNQHIFKVKFDKIPFEKSFFKYVISAKLDHMSSVAHGATMKHITKKNFDEITIPYPPLLEQRRLAEILSTVNLLIEQRKHQIEKLDLLAKSRFIEMFGDPVENPKKWATCPLSTLGTFKNGMNFSSNERGIEIRCLGVGDFKNLSIINTPTKLPIISLAFTPSAEYLLQDGDIIFVRSNGNKALVGRCVAIYTHGLPVTFSGFCIRFRVGSDAVNIMYLLRVLKADTIRKKMAGRGANIQNLNQKMLARLVIPIPPIALQNEFAAFIEQLDKSKFTIRRSLEKLEMLYQALLQEYFG